VPSPISYTIKGGKAGSDSIWYQQEDFVTLRNVRNPVNVSVVYLPGVQNVEASICFNSFESFQPISGLNIHYNCPTGGYGKAANATPTDFTDTNATTLKTAWRNQRKVLSDDDDDFDGSQSFSAQLNLKPTRGASGGFIVSIPDADIDQDFELIITTVECDPPNYPIGPGGNCTTIPSVGDSNNIFTINSGAWKYWTYTAPLANLAGSLNTISVYLNGTDFVDFFTQSGYYPTQEWYLNTEDEYDDDELTATIMTPSTISSNETYFFAVYNPADESVTLNLTIGSSQCDSTHFGYDCQHSTQNTTDPIAGYQTLSASLVSIPANTSSETNNGTAWEFDYASNDYENDYAYFALVNFTQLTAGDMVRVTVGNNNVRENAPALYAKLGGFPSAQSNMYNASTEDDVAHQIMIPVTDSDINGTAEIWYLAVALPADFSIWIGVNCANNCSNQEHGTCYCNNSTCDDVTSNFENFVPFYKRPTSLEDSGGACTCSDDDYDSSFDCGTRNNPYLWAWLILVIVVILILLFVVVAVPIFFIIQKRKRYSGYETVDDA